MPAGSWAEAFRCVTRDVPGSCMKDPTRRLFVAAAAATAWLTLPTRAAAQDPRWSAPDGAVILLRHAIAPGVGDPANFRLGDCSTQRNLDAAGQAQASKLGRRMRIDGVNVRKLVSSQWCRTLETARLAFPAMKVNESPVFNSFFAQQERNATQTALAIQELNRWRGSGVLLVVTHQVNITALTGVVPDSGEAVVVQPTGKGLQVLWRLAP